MENVSWISVIATLLIISGFIADAQHHATAGGHLLLAGIGAAILSLRDR